MLTKNPRTHAILFRDGTKINITESQYDLYREEVNIKKHNEFIKIHDIDTNELLYEGRCSEIKEFKQKRTDPSLAQAVFICSFGERHPLSMQGDCDCSKKYDCIGIIFMDKIRELGYKVDYARDITEEMRKVYLNNK